MGTLNTFSSGINTTFSTELNENFALAASILGNDVGSDTWTTTDTSYTEIGTVACSATTKNYALIMISVYLDAAAQDTPHYSTPAVEVQVGETGSEAQVKEWSPALEVEDSNIETRAQIRSTTTLYYLHTLTAGEKSNGFNVIVNGKYTVSGSPIAATSTHRASTATSAGSTIAPTTLILARPSPSRVASTTSDSLAYRRLPPGRSTHDASPAIEL